MYPFRLFDSAYRIYPLFEGDLALGQAGYQKVPPITLPRNHNEEDVKNQVIDIYDSDAIEGDDFGLCNDQLSIIAFCEMKENDLLTFNILLMEANGWTSINISQKAILN
jgi:hypothetical protein